MTPDEMREVLLDEARWWANKPEHSGSATKWITFFEQLPEDAPLLLLLASEYQDANAYRNRPWDLGVNQFSVWNMACNIFQKVSQNWEIPARPDLASD